MSRIVSLGVSRSLLSAAAFLTLAACEQPNPLVAADPIGEFPKNWGATFNEDAQAGNPDSLLMNGTQEGPAPTGPEGSQRGGTAVPGKDPMAGADYGGGNADKGRQAFLQQCAMCHGAEGKGGEVMGLVVPTLRDKAWHDRLTDDQIAVTIAHGKGKMPAFIGKLSKEDINGVVAFLRTLKNAE